MAFRFRKSVNFGPLRVNLSKKGAGWSIGGKGARFTKSADGRSYSTYSIPGTGVSYRSYDHAAPSPDDDPAAYEYGDEDAAAPVVLHTYYSGDVYLSPAGAALYAQIQAGDCAVYRSVLTFSLLTEISQADPQLFAAINTALEALLPRAALVVRKVSLYGLILGLAACFVLSILTDPDSGVSLAALYVSVVSLFALAISMMCVGVRQMRIKKQYGDVLYL